MTIISEPMTTPVIACSALNLTRVFGRGQDAVRAVDQVSVNIESGRFTVLLDPTAGGASALLACLSGKDEPTSGHAFCAVEDIVFTHDTAQAADLEQLRRHADAGQTVVMATGSLASAAYADRVIVLHHGRVAADIHHQRPLDATAAAA